MPKKPTGELIDHRSGCSDELSHPSRGGGGGECLDIQSHCFPFPGGSQQGNHVCARASCRLRAEFPYKKASVPVSAGVFKLPATPFCPKHYGVIPELSFPQFGLHASVPSIELIALHEIPGNRQGVRQISALPRPLRNSFPTQQKQDSTVNADHTSERGPVTSLESLP